MATKPREVNWAIFLILAAFAIAPIKAAMDWSYLKNLGPIQISVFVGVATLLLLSYFIWKVSQGRNWARITLLVLFLLGLPTYFFHVRAEFGRSAILPVLSILQALMQGTGLLLIFKAPAKDWFKKPDALNS
jgi:cell division protein FtsW (lipid II flippase)